MIAQAFEDLSQGLRVLLELRSRASDLFSVDFPEAVGNIENGLTAVLNAYHSLYDAMGKHGTRNRIDWYGTPELATILALRNARHHNICSKVRTLFRYHLDVIATKSEHRHYLEIDFQPGEEDGMTFDVHMSVSDFSELLSLPSSESKLRSSVGPVVSEYLNLPAMLQRADSESLSVGDAFFNVVPLLVNAGIAIHPHIRDAIIHKSTESEYFDFHFREVLPAHTQNHKYTVFEFWRPD